MATSKKMYKLEFELKISANMLYNLLSTPSGLAEWFCNDVDIKNSEYIFKWTGEIRNARVLRKMTNKHIRFQWTDSEEDEYFEFEIEKDEITGDIALIITDFSPEKELNENRRLWESQVHEMQVNMGMG